MSQSTLALAAINNTPSTFGFNGHPIRVVMVNSEPWFVCTDVAEALGYRNAPDASRHLDADEKGTHILRTLGGDQKLTIISESGLYALVLRSRKPEARKFAKWVTSEVLPSIRKNGGYGTPQRTIQAQALAAAISQRIFQTLMQSESDLRTQRWNVRFDRDSREQDLNVQITPIPSNAYIMSFAKLARNIEIGEVGCAASDVELLAIASACTDRVARRMQQTTQVKRQIR